MDLFDRLLPSPFALMLAAIPLVGYLGILAAVRVSGRSLITTGGRDAAALGVAISGLAAIGPAELFFPTPAAIMFGPLVWVMLALFYLLCVTLIALTTRPKLVIYGRTAEEMYEPLLRAVGRLDPEARGDADKLQVESPRLGLHLRLDGHRGIDHAEVLAFETTYPPKFWSELLGALRGEVTRLPAPTPRRGIPMLVLASLLAVLLLWRGIEQRAVVVEEFRQWLWR